MKFLRADSGSERGESSGDSGSESDSSSGSGSSSRSGSGSSGDESPKDSGDEGANKNEARSGSRAESRASDVANSSGLTGAESSHETSMNETQDPAFMTQDMSLSQVGRKVSGANEDNEEEQPPSSQFMTQDVPVNVPEPQPDTQDPMFMTQDVPADVPGSQEEAQDPAFMTQDVPANIPDSQQETQDPSFMTQDVPAYVPDSQPQTQDPSFMTQDVPANIPDSQPQTQDPSFMTQDVPVGDVPLDESQNGPSSPAAKSGSDADSESEHRDSDGSDVSPGRKKKLSKKKNRRAILDSDDEDEGKKSGDDGKRRSRSRSNSKSSRSSKSRSKSRSKSKSGSGSGSGSDSDAKKKNESKGSGSGSDSDIGKRPKKTQTKGSGSGSGSDSDVKRPKKAQKKGSGSGSGSDSDIGRPRKRKSKGSGSGSSDSDVGAKKKKKRKSKGSGSDSGSGSKSSSGSGSGSSSASSADEKEPEKELVEQNIEEPLPPPKPVVESSSDDEKPRDGDDGTGMSDFDVMLARKKAEKLTQRKRKRGTDIISDADDLIEQLISDMLASAQEDRDLHKHGQPATKKLMLLPYAEKMLNKADLQNAFLDSNVLAAITEWLAPMPKDKSLPAQKIRTTMLKLLKSFPTPDKHALKSSGIGKAVMYLYKHPKETKDNRRVSGKIIADWSRPIFNNTANLKSMSKEDREARDQDQLPYAKKRRTDDDGDEPGLENASKPKKSAPKTLTDAGPDDDRPKKPGDPGWVNRARVPAPSTKDYVVRPKSKLDGEVTSSRSSGSGIKKDSRYDRQMKKFMEMKRSKKSLQAVTISIEGRRMAL